MSTEELKQAIVAAGGEVNDLPDNLTTTLMQRLCDTLGIDTSDMTDNLLSSYLKQITSEYSGGGGGSAPVTLQDKTFTENGTYTPDEGYDGFGSVTVDVVSSGGGAVSGAGWEPCAEDGVTCTGETVTIPPTGSMDLRFYFMESDNDILLITIDGVICVAFAEGYNYTIYGHDNLYLKGSSKGMLQVTTLNEESITCTLKIERYNAG